MNGLLKPNTHYVHYTEDKETKFEHINNVGEAQQRYDFLTTQTGITDIDIVTTDREGFINGRNVRYKLNNTKK